MKNNLYSHDTNFLIPGAIGKLEIIIETPKEHIINTTAIICHPHPLYGGAMENKVVTTMARAFRELGMMVIRFNFRGVGKSEGTYANGIGESDDLTAVYQWAKQRLPDNKIILAGFSFGAYVATRVAGEQTIHQLITISPPVNHFDFDSLVKPKVPWLIVQGTNDDVVPAEEVFGWLAKQTFPYELIILEAASHFFHGRLVELKDKIVQYLEKIDL